ncbi:hypothetical protein E3N88_38951 [Mikania micrantha]|uniref:Uncharacterized protein n=1 Tax=Mikania micrantha TaxID=192012 RepID=A0A5N6LVD8_9ASTR|nr:hypothetical protein E3N88_38951 [Mikania micrantha]
MSAVCRPYLQTSFAEELDKTFSVCRSVANGSSTPWMDRQSVTSGGGRGGGRLRGGSVDGKRHRCGPDALALPLGMSIVAFFD